MHHRTIQINHQPDATIFQFIILTFAYSSTSLCCVRGWAGRPARPRTQHDYHHNTKVKPEAATAVIELLMMGGKTPETCWAVNKPQDNKMENCCIWLVIYLNCTMMHGLTNLKCVLLYCLFPLLSSRALLSHLRKRDWLQYGHAVCLCEEFHTRIKFKKNNN